MENSRISLNDLKAHHNSIKEEINSAISSVIEKSQFIGGDELKIFEDRFAKYCEKKYCIGTSSGTSALHTVLECFGIKEEDEVIIPVNTFAATAFAVTMTRATPVFIDVNENDYLINVELIERKINEKTKAIIPVHLFGSPCDMERISILAEKYNLRIIEDCAQAHGSLYMEKKIPVSGVGCFSFFPSKVIGALGDAGAIVCNDEELARKCKMFVNQGRKEKYFHEIKGFNHRLDNLQASILNVKLNHLDPWIKKRQEVIKIYNRELFKTVKIPIENGDIINSNYAYVIRANQRDKLMKFLEIRNIETVIYYPIPLHIQPAFSFLGYKKGDFPIAEKLSEEIISLPLYPELSSEKQQKVIESIKEFYLDNSSL